MDRKFKSWEIAGIIFCGVVGTLLHFTYAWSLGNQIVGALSAVNESVWEHTKLVAVPFIFWAIIEFIAVGRHFSRFFYAKLCGAIGGIFFIIAFYYTYTGALGAGVLWVDVATFYLSVLVAFYISYNGVLTPRPFPKALGLMCAAALAGLMALYVVWTYNPPGFPLFISA